MTFINVVTCPLLMARVACGTVYVQFSIVRNACSTRNWPEVCPEICLVVVLVFLSLTVVYFKELEFLRTLQTVNVFRNGKLVHV
jgi:hypothetical protein